MRIKDILKQYEKGVSFEFFPPKTKKMEKALITTVRVLKAYKPLYVSMTCSAGGIKQDKTEDAVNILLEEKGLVVMPHLTCIGASISTIKNMLDKYKNKGIENIMALRGDQPQNNIFNSSMRDFRYARDLVAYIKKYSHFCIGVAVYPEGHIETKSLEEDTEYTKQKIDAGADFAVTQMFFDNTYYYALLDRLKKKGVTIPILPGILPLTNLVKVKEFASICRATIPKKIEQTLMRFIGQPKDMEKAGIDFTIKQCQDLQKNGVQRLHFFTLNKLQVIKTILDAI
jgi:methylenetetrahydrofolate reductase (NADPH)